VVGSGRMELKRAVRASSVVVPGVLGQDSAQVPFAEDQHSVGHVRSDREHEPLAKAFACGLRGGIFTAAMPASVRSASNVQ
jgi:hypothetical protein